MENREAVYLQIHISSHLRTDLLEVDAFSTLEEVVKENGNPSSIKFLQKGTYN